MKSSVHPELPTAALRPSQATHVAVDNSAPSAIAPESTYKSGKAVQTSGATSLARKADRGSLRSMRELLILAIHLVVTFAKLLHPGGARAVAAGSLLLKHQLLISNRSRQRAPNLSALDRFVLGLTTLFVSPQRIPQLGCTHQARNAAQIPQSIDRLEISAPLFLFCTTPQARPQRALPGTHRGNPEDEAAQPRIRLLAHRPADLSRL